MQVFIKIELLVAYSKTFLKYYRIELKCKITSLFLLKNFESSYLRSFSSNMSEIMCPSLEAPMSGQFRNPFEARYGSTLVVDCDKDYFLSGDNDVECTDEDNDGVGEWDKTLPTCDRKLFDFTSIKMSNILKCCSNFKNVLFLGGEVGFSDHYKNFKIQ